MSLISSIVNSWYGPILGFVLGLIPLIIIHEVGHFIMAKLFGVWVREFGIGYPPRIVKLFRWKETDFTLNWLPLGGFARMEGEQTFTPEDEKEKVTDPKVLAEREEARQHSLYSKGPWQRIAIYLGGPIMNLIAAWLIAVLIFTTGVPIYETVIGEIAPGSPADVTGMAVGDVIVAVADTPIEDVGQVSTEVSKYLGEEIKVTLRRDAEEIDVNIVPRENPPEGEGSMGIVITGQEIPGTLEHYTFGEALRFGTAAFGRMTVTTVMLPVYIARMGLTFKEARPVGVIGISQVAQYSMAQSIDQNAAYPFLEMLLMISISLGIFNLLPIPALDGGRILFSLLEKLRGKPLTPALEERIHMVALLIMVALFVGITALDIISPVPLP